MRLSTLVLAGAVCAGMAAYAQNPLSTELKQMYGSVKNNLIKMAEKMPEDQYGFKPTTDIRTFGQLIGHVADSQARTCSTLNGEMKNINAGQKTSKADLVAAIKESFTLCDQTMDALTDANATEMVKTARGQRSRLGALAALIAHSNEEYGYMAVYMRLKGVVPPSSEGR
jgi:uncharacterized damage-inducible protein DinB